MPLLAPGNGPLTTLEGNTVQPINPNMTLMPTTQKAQTARSQDSSGAISVLPDMPATGVIGRIELIADTTELQPALMEAINEAKTSIKADFHLLKGREGQELARQLARRARHGVRVQILAWGTPTQAMVDAIKAARSHGLAVRFGATDGAGTEASGKFLLVDDRLALVGPLRYPSRSRHSRRGLLRLTGEASAELGRQFNHDWAKAGGQPLPLPETGLLMRTGTHELLSLVQIGGVGPHRKAPKGLVMGAISAARTSIEVAMDAMDDPDVLLALVAARKRGVKVEVLMSGLSASEGTGLARLFGGDGQSAAIARLIAAGIPVRRYQSAGTAQAHELRYAMVDSHVLLFGTMAWTRTGLAAPGELLVEARGGRELGLIQATFRHDWDHAAPASAPAVSRRLIAEVSPLMAELSRVVGKYSPVQAASDLMNTYVGVVKVGKKVKLVADVRR